MSTTTAIELDRSSPVPLYRQIEDHVRISIHDGRLRPGARLPGIRTLAHDLGVARVTVATAYEQLTAEGYLEGRVGSGTRVAADPPGSRPPVALPAPSRQAARGVTRLDLRPGAIPAEGVPGGFPAAAWEARLRAAWHDVSSALSPPPAGAADLRGALSGYLDAGRGTRTDPGRIVVGRGPRVLVAALVGALDREGGPERIPVLGLLAPVDPELRELARRTGAATLDISPEQATLHAAAGVVLVEDDRSALLRLAGPPAPARQGSLAIGRLVLLGGLDPLMVPGVSLGWVVVPSSLADAVASAVVDLDGAPSAVEQHALAGWIADGGLDRRARRLRHALVSRRVALEAALRAELGDLATIEPPSSRPVATIQLAAGDVIRNGIVAAARVAGVTIATPEPDGRLPLGFASLPEEGLVDAVRRLGRAIDALDRELAVGPRHPLRPLAGRSSVGCFRAVPRIAGLLAAPARNTCASGPAGSTRSAGPSSGVEGRRPSLSPEHPGQSRRLRGVHLARLRSRIVPAVAAVLLGLAACSLPAAAPSGSAPGTTVASSPVGNVFGVATAGPVCPVERPGDSACAPRPVGDAVIVVTQPDGKELARVTTATDGSFNLDLPAGEYLLVPQPVDGLLGTAPSVPFTVGSADQPGASLTPLRVEYDTGIR